MDIEGVRRWRAVYRSPGLMIEKRRVEFRPPSRPDLAHIKSGPIVISDIIIRNTVIHESIPVPPVVDVKPVPEEPGQQAIIAQKSKVEVKRKRFPHFMYMSAVTVFVVGGFLAYQAFMANATVDIQIKKIQTTVNADGTIGASSLPIEEKPKDPNYVQNYKVSPLLPQLMTIKKIGVTARVLQVGVDKDNRMEVPKTAYDVAWYNGSSRPGENGAMVIDGHVQGVGGPAIFTNLKKISDGDIIELKRGDGKVFTYVVAKTETVAVKDVDMGKLLVSFDTSKPGLNLITCAGIYDKNNDQFDSRSIVYAIQQ